MWLLEELGLDYELKIYKRGSDMLAPPELKDVHPLGKSPVLEIRAPGNPRPIILAESGALTEYLIDHFGKHLTPQKYPDGKEGQLGAETEEWIRYKYYLHYNEGTLMLYLVVALLISSKFDPSVIKNGPADHFQTSKMHPSRFLSSLSPGRSPDA